MGFNDLDSANEIRHTVIVSWHFDKLRIHRHFPDRRYHPLGYNHERNLSLFTQPVAKAIRDGRKRTKGSAELSVALSSRCKCASFNLGSTRDERISRSCTSSCTEREWVGTGEDWRGAQCGMEMVIVINLVQVCPGSFRNLSRLIRQTGYYPARKNFLI